MKKKIFYSKKNTDYSSLSIKENPNMTKKRFKINDRIRRIYLQQKKGLFVKTVKKN